MSSTEPRLPPLRLVPTTYESLRQQVLRRDRWRCQPCGTMSNLEAHHQEFRSHCGDDSEGNLITLCSVHATPASIGETEYQGSRLLEHSSRHAIEIEPLPITFETI